VVPVPDQQEREHAGEFPEEHQLKQIARQHHAEHRAHERQKESEESRDRIARRHVVASVEDDQKADAGDQQAEHPGQAIHAHGEIQTCCRHPGELQAHAFA
jgi:hypothetical protein